jgi:putative DNA primase/helicase
MTSVALALWIVATWFADDVQVAPILNVKSPTARCGKTTTLDIVGRLSRRSLMASSISPAALFRTVEKFRPTLIIDEADALLGENEELRGIINSGHTRQTAYVIRTVGEDHEPKQFSTWGFKAIAGIGKLTATIEDRSIPIALKRKLPGEKVERLRHAARGAFEALVRKIARFAEDNGEAVVDAKPDLPGALNDWAQDNWEPLLAIADIAGGRWPQGARQVALEMSGINDEPTSIGERLLANIRKAFSKDAKLSMADLVQRLASNEESPWATRNNGKPITPRQLGEMLKPYHIKSKAVHLFLHNKPKGFERAQFEEAWTRYPPQESPSSPVTQSATNEINDLSRNAAQSPLVTSVTQSPLEGRNDKVNGDQATEVTGGDRRQLPAHSLKSFEGDQVTDGAPQDAAPPHVDFASRQVSRTRV